MRCMVPGPTPRQICSAVSLERRYLVARGTLIVLETIPADPLFAPSYAERWAFMESLRIPLEPCYEWIPAG